MEHQPLSKRDDQSMATIARVSCYKLEHARELTESAQFDNSFFKDQCIDVFNSIKQAKLDNSTLKSFFTEANQKKFKGNIFFGWLKSFALRSPRNYTNAKIPTRR